MSLRAESIKAYRKLFRAATATATQCALYNQAGFQRYVSSRFAQESEQNRKQLSVALRDLEQHSSQLGHTQSHASNVSTLSQRRHRKEQGKILKQFERYVSTQINYANDLATLIPNAVGDEALTSTLQVLAAGIGNIAYQRTLEENFLQFFEFEEKRNARDEATEEATSDRQNRIMQQALLPYGERLLLVHRTAIGQGNQSSDLSYLSPWQVTEAITGTRSEVTAHYMRLGRDHIVLEVDEAFNKQVIYVCCTRSEGMDSGSYNWDQDVERVEVSESEEMRKTLIHSEHLLTATQLCDALVNETPLHPTRKTVLVGHAVGGAVALVMAFLLAQRGFEITNTISFGAPKSCIGTLERNIAAVNAVRVVLAGDPLIELPVTGTDGAPFVHVGEILLLSPSSRTAASEGNTDTEPTVGDSAPAEQRDLRATNRYARNSNRANIATADEEKVPMGGDNVIENPAQSLDSVSADALSDMLAMDDATDFHGELAPSTEKSSAPLDELDGSVAREEEAVSDVEASDGENEEDLRELCRIASARYSASFLVEDYVRHLADPNIPLTYAEGDEVWDDGDYATYQNETSRSPYVSAEEQRQRDEQGAL